MRLFAKQRTPAPVSLEDMYAEVNRAWVLHREVRHDKGDMPSYRYDRMGSVRDALRRSLRVRVHVGNNLEPCRIAVVPRSRHFLRGERDVRMPATAFGRDDVVHEVRGHAAAGAVRVAKQESARLLDTATGPRQISYKRSVERVRQLKQRVRHSHPR